LYFDWAEVSLDGVICRGCRSGLGGGAYIWHSRVLAEDWQVVNNNADRGAGLLAVFSVVTIGRGSIIAGNEAMDNGGAISEGYSDLEITGALIVQNYALLGGGAITAGGGGAITIRESTITDNATSPLGGGGVRVAEDGQVTFDRTILRGNCADSEANDLVVSRYALARFYQCAIDTTAIIVKEHGAVLRSSAQLFTDPMLCGIVGCMAHGPVSYGLQPGSPCLPENNRWAESIGGLVRCPGK
jgi:hypothetical protein